MKNFKESRTSPRQIYRKVNGEKNTLQHESSEELKKLVEDTLFQFGLKYETDIFRKLNTDQDYPYHVWKALPTQGLVQRWLIGIWPGFDGHDYQFKIYAADTLDQIKNNEVEPLAEYEGTNSIDELISDLEDAFKYFINEDFKEFQKYPQADWEQMEKEGRVDVNGNVVEPSSDSPITVDADENFHIFKRGDFDAYKASIEHPLDESKMRKNLRERVLDYDTYDEFYKKGCEAYFEGKSLDEVPVTGNAWFREAWQEGWKESKAIDDEDARRAEAEYEEELEWEEAYREGLVESEEYQYQILKKSEIKKLDFLKKEVKETSESMGKDDVWVEWHNYAMEIGKKYLGDNVRYDTGDENHFYDSYENKMEIDPYQTWSSQSIDKMIAVRLACFKE